jgi:ribosomal protein S18 acetylase RimI-like enzyme
MIQVRATAASDAPRIAHIHVATWRAAYRGQMPDDYLAGLDERRRAEFWRKRVTEATGVVLVGEIEGEVIGFCDFMPSRDDDADAHKVGEIVALYVLPEHWRRGAGRALCRRALQFARNDGFTAITLWVLETNLQGRTFYESMGFGLDGGRKTELLNQQFQITEMRYRLELPAGGDSS